jgi:diadenylate cyclase
MSYPNLGWVLQILILTTGIYIFLRFLRTTRGHGLIRGLVVALLFGAVGIWGLSKLLGLSELEHIVQSVTGFVVVIFAILFQPELRRGIAQLGEHPLLGRLLDQRQPETVSEVAQAVVNLAKKRCGALVAFEREMPLDGYIENGVEIDSAAKSILIESIFHPGGELHDGAVIIRKDRVAAALCLFPLTENIEISKSTGTRHRAALGLTDASDAVTVAVSEETGGISICRHGSMQRNVPPDKVESALREALHTEAQTASEGPGDPITFVRELACVDAPRKLAALALAVALFFLAHQEISSTREFNLRVSACGPETVARAAPGELLIQLPSEDDHLVQPRTGEILRVVLSGPSDALDKLGRELGGVVEVDSTWLQGSRRLSPRQVTWGPGKGPKELRLSVAWAGEEPSFAYQTYVRREIELRAEHAPIDASGLQAPFEAELDGVAFDPPSVVVSGPRKSIGELDSGALQFSLEPAVLPSDLRDTWIERLPLASRLTDAGVSLEGIGSVRVTLPVRMTRVNLGPIEKPIVLVSFAPGGLGELNRFELAPEARTARLHIETSGIMPAGTSGPDGPSHEEIALRTLVEDQLVVFADVSERDGAPGVPVRWSWRIGWREALSSELGFVPSAARISVHLDSQPTVALIARGRAETMPQEDPRH